MHFEKDTKFGGDAETCCDQAIHVVDEINLLSKIVSKHYLWCGACNKSARWHGSSLLKVINRTVDGENNQLNFLNMTLTQTSASAASRARHGVYCIWALLETATRCRRTKRVCTITNDEVDATSRHDNCSSAFIIKYVHFCLCTSIFESFCSYTIRNIVSYSIWKTLAMRVRTMHPSNARRSGLGAWQTKTRSSADADNGLDAFVGQSRLTNISGPFQVK